MEDFFIRLEEKTCWLCGKKEVVKSTVFHETVSCLHCSAEQKNQKKTPDSGICVMTLPEELVFSVRCFARQFDAFRDPIDLDKYRQPLDWAALDPALSDLKLDGFIPARLRCSLLDEHTGEEKQRVELYEEPCQVREEIEADYEESVNAEIDRHGTHGDCLELRMCAYKSARLFFDGRLELVEKYTNTDWPPTAFTTYKTKVIQIESVSTEQSLRGPLIVSNLRALTEVMEHLNNFVRYSDKCDGENYGGDECNHHAWHGAWDSLSNTPR